MSTSDFILLLSEQQTAAGTASRSVAGRLREAVFFFGGEGGGVVFLTPCAGMGLEPFKAILQIQTAPVAVLTLERL